MPLSYLHSATSNKKNSLTPENENEEKTLFARFHDQMLAQISRTSTVLNMTSPQMSTQNVALDMAGVLRTNIYYIMQ